MEKVFKRSERNQRITKRSDVSVWCGATCV